MYVNKKTGNKLSVQDMQKYADENEVSIEEYARDFGFVLEEVAQDTTSADLLDPTTFQKDAAADADVVSQPMTASQAEYVEPEDTELAPVDTSLDSQSNEPFVINGKPVTEQEFEDYKKDLLTKKMAENMSFADKLMVDLMKGGGTLGEMLASIPETIYDIGAIPQNIIAEVFDIKGLKASSKKTKEALDIKNPILEYYQKETDKLEKVQNIYNDKNYDYQGISKNFQKGNYSDGFKQLASGITESAPISISMMMGGAAASTKQLITGSTVAFAGPEIEDQLNKEGQSELTSVIKGLGLAGAESVFSSIGSGTIGKVYKDIILKEGKEEGVKIFRNGLVEMYSNAIKKFGAPASMVGEGIEEVATTVTQNLINGIDPFSNITDSFIQGVGGGTLYGSPVNAVKITEAVKSGIANVSVNKNLKKSNFKNISEVFLDANANETQLNILKNKGSLQVIESRVDKDILGGRLTKADGDEIKTTARDTQGILNRIETLKLNEKTQVKVVDLIKEKSKLDTEIKRVNDKALTNSQIERVNSINEELQTAVANDMTLSNIETVEKLTKNVEGLTIESLDNAEAITNFIEENNIDVDSKKASNEQGFIYQNPKTGEQTIVINKEIAAKDRAVNVAAHEFLHGLIFQTVKNSPETQIALGKSLNEYINKIDVNQIKDSNFAKRLESYKDMDEATQSEEVLTLFSDAIATGDIQFNESVFTKIGDVIRRTLQNLGVKVKFNNGKDVYNFVKDYNKSIEKGKLTKAQKAVGKKGAEGALVLEKTVEAEPGIKESKSVTDLQTELDNLDQSDFDFDPDEFENAKDNLKFKINAAKKKEIAKPIEKNKTKIKTDPKKNEKELGNQIKEMVPLGTTQKEYKEKIAIKVIDRLDDGMFNPLIKKIAASYNIVADNVYGKSWDDFFQEVISVQFKKNIMSFNPELNDDLGGYIIGSQYGVRNRVKEALAKFKKEGEGGFKEDVSVAKNVIAREDAALQEAEKRKYTPLTKSNIVPNFTITAITDKLTKVLASLESKITAKRGDNAATTPLIAEIKKKIGKVVGDPEAAPKLVIQRLGKLKDGTYEKNLIKHKKAIIENMTTTFLMGKDSGSKVSGGIPQAIEKSVGGKFTGKKVTVNVGGKEIVQEEFIPNFVPYPEWVGQKIDREKTLVRGATAGNEIVRRVPANKVSDADFVGLFIDEKGKLIRGKREALGKAIAEEVAFEILSKEIQNENSEISKAFEGNQEAQGEILSDNFVNELTRDIDRGTVKFSLSTGDARLDKARTNLGNYITSKYKFPNGLSNEQFYNLIKTDDPLKELFDSLKNEYNRYLGRVKTDRMTELAVKFNASGNDNFNVFINNYFDNRFSNISSALGVDPNSISRFKIKKETAQKTKSFLQDYILDLIDKNPKNAAKTFITTLQSALASGTKQSLFGTNKNLYKFIKSIKQDKIKKAFNNVKLVQSAGGLTFQIGKEKVTTKFKQETSASDFNSLINEYKNNVEVVKRNEYADKAANAFLDFIDYLKDNKIDPEITGLLLNSLGGSMRSSAKTLAKIKGAFIVEGFTARDYTFEHGIPTNQLLVASALYIYNKNNNINRSFIKNIIDKSSIYIIPTKISDAIDSFYRNTFSNDKALSEANPEFYRYFSKNKYFQDYLKKNGIFEFKESNITNLLDPKKSVKINIKFSKGIELNLVETGQQAINNARSLAYNNNVKRLDVKAEDISELTTNKAKADWLINKIAEGYNDFYFIDNKMNEVKAVKNVLNTFDVKGKVQQAKVKFSKSMNTTFNEMLQRSTGIEAGETIERSIARRRGATKGKFKVWMPSSLDDFKGLTSYTFAGKGKQGEADQKFFQDALITPYFRGIRAIEQSRQAFKDDFKALNKQMRPVLKKLGKIVPGTEFTHDQAIRVALWTASGYDIPGISESDIKTLVDFVNDNAGLSEYARKLQLISKRKEWSKPGDFWDAETILSDLNNLTEKVGRKEYLTEFIENVDIIFSEDNLNKVEAGYGEAQKEALKDIIYRMKNGTNRPSGSKKNENRFNNWVNNSIGAIMFFNRRSALLQTLSIANFINWGDNNVLKAGAAFANQPQYWKDFATLFNSSKLKQRRSGLKSDVNEAEIANAVKGSRNKAVSALSYLLKIGFTPTQLADSFAIASGGATFYRNRANSYLKEVNAEGEKVYTQKQAEEKAFEDFSQISEETQQSGDPALISSDQASTLGRLLLAFQNTPIQLNRSIKKAALDIKNRRRTPGQTMLQSDFSNISKIIYYGTVQNIIFSALQNALFALIPGFEDEDDELTEEEQLEKYGKIYSTKQSRIVNGMVDTTLKGGFGVTGAFISTIKNAYLEWEKQKEKGFIGDQGYTILAALNFSPPVGSKLRKIYSAIKTEEFDKDVIAKRGWDITIDGKFNLSPKYKVLGSVTEGLTNLPLDRMVAEISSITEALDARNSKWQRIALALGWKTWDVNVKNEEHELIKTEAKAKRKEEGKEKAKETRSKNKKTADAFYKKVGETLSRKEKQKYFSFSGKTRRRKYLDEIAKQKGIK